MISVVMATHNGAATLPLTLEAFKRIQLPSEGVEIVAVDNASTDDTREILERYRDSLPMSVLAESRQGKCFALNRALDVARGGLLVFADDDVLPEPQWLVAFVTAAARLRDVDIFAGQVRHHWLRPPPPWLRRLADEGRSYGGTPVDQPEGPVPATFFKGANFAARRKVIETVRFCERPDVNFSGTDTSAGGEDSGFVRDAMALGHRTHYVAAAGVRHIVRYHQVGIRPVLQRYLRIGRSMTLQDPKQFNPDGARVFGYPRYLFRTLPRDTLRALRYWVAGDSYAAANEMIGVAMTCGRAQQWRRQMAGAGRDGAMTGLEDRV